MISFGFTPASVKISAAISLASERVAAVPHMQAVTGEQLGVGEQPSRIQAFIRLERLSDGTSSSWPISRTASR